MLRALLTRILLVRIAGPIGPEWRAGVPVVFVDSTERRGALLLAHEVVDDTEQSLVAARELLAGALDAAGLDDGSNVVGAEVALDELSRRNLDARRLRKADVLVVEDDHEYASVELLAVAPHIGFDRLGLVERRIELLDRDINQRSDRYLLRFSLLEHLEIVLRQVADEVSLLIGDDGVDLDVVDLDLEGDRRLLWRRFGRRRLLSR